MYEHSKHPFSNLECIVTHDSANIYQAFKQEFNRTKVIRNVSEHTREIFKGLDELDSEDITLLSRIVTAMDPTEVNLKFEVFLFNYQILYTELMNQNKQIELKQMICKSLAPAEQAKLKSQIFENLKDVKKYEKKIDLITKLKKLYPFWTCFNRSFLPSFNFKGTESRYKQEIRTNIPKMTKVFVSKLKFDVYKVQQLKDISQDVMNKGVERFKIDTNTESRIKKVIEEFEKFYQEYSNLIFLQNWDYTLISDEFVNGFFEGDAKNEIFEKPNQSVFSTFSHFQRILLKMIGPITKTVR